VLLADDGGRTPKHVGGNIIRMYFTYFVCASIGFFNSKKKSFAFCLIVMRYLSPR